MSLEGAQQPQHEQMASESMVRTLAAQAEAIWPQERELIARYDLPAAPRILDLGCGTGEATRRLAAMHPAAQVLGIDLIPERLASAREAALPLGDRVQFQTGDAHHLELTADRFDLAVCRHVLQAVPDPRRVLEELRRVTRPGGFVHLLAEDYGMIFFHPTALDSSAFWRDGPCTYARRTSTDLESGRKMFTSMTELGFTDITVDHVTVDTVRVPRPLFAAIWRAWRDGYAGAIAAHTDLSLERVHAHWEDMIACIENPAGYGCWQIPVVSGRVPS